MANICLQSVLQRLLVPFLSRYVCKVSSHFCDGALPLLLCATFHARLT